MVEGKTILTFTLVKYYRFVLTILKPFTSRELMNFTYLADAVQQKMG